MLDGLVVQLVECWTGVSKVVGGWSCSSTGRTLLYNTFYYWLGGGISHLHSLSEGARSIRQLVSRCSLVVK